MIKLELTPDEAEAVFVALDIRIRQAREAAGRTVEPHRLAYYNRRIEEALDIRRRLQAVLYPDLAKREVNLSYPEPRTIRILIVAFASGIFVAALMVAAARFLRP